MFSKALDTIFSKGFNTDSFRVHINNKVDRRGSNFRTREGRTLSLWCFNPGIAIAGLTRDAHALILTSGTLSPLSSFASEFNMPFPIRLENDHLIEKSQVLVGVLPKGPRNNVLSSDYNTRSTDEYQMELGNTLINLVRRIPDGMLVFFASYAHMNNCVEFWETHKIGSLSIYDHLQKHKRVVQEPKGGGQAAVQEVIDLYTEALNSSSVGGGLLFAVMRGKISEGMDFADKHARCVVIAGIPYPYLKDPRVSAKRTYMTNEVILHNKNKNSSSASSSSSGETPFNGSEWYQMQAARAVNQAVGRLIRHRHDYGVILLADKRFGWQSNRQSLSKWIQPYIGTFDNFGKVSLSLKKFFDGTKKWDALYEEKKAKLGKSHQKNDTILEQLLLKMKGGKILKLQNGSLVSADVEMLDPSVLDTIVDIVAPITTKSDSDSVLDATDETTETVATESEDNSAKPKPKAVLPDWKPRKRTFANAFSYKPYIHEKKAKKQKIHSLSGILSEDLSDPDY